LQTKTNQRVILSTKVPPGEGGRAKDPGREGKRECAHSGSNNQRSGRGRKGKVVGVKMKKTTKMGEEGKIQ